MDDLSQKINEFLSSPQAMEQLQGVLGMLQGGQESAPPPPQQPSSSEPDLSSLLGDIKPEDLTKMTALLGNLRPSADDPKVNLLLALKPYLNEKRQDKLDTAIRLLQLSRMSPLLKELL